MVAANHTVILNWNRETIPLLRQIAICQLERGSDAFQGCTPDNRMPDHTLQGVALLRSDRQQGLAVQPPLLQPQAALLVATQVPEPEGRGLFAGASGRQASWRRRCIPRVAALADVIHVC